MSRIQMRPKSHALYEKLCRVIPGGVNSPVRACKAMQMLPIVVESAQEDTLTDCDNFSYIDYCMSWGALLHGHAHPKILSACIKQMHKGTSYGATTGIEQALAEKITAFVPSCEKVRFVSSGTEATMSAIRLTRGYTNRPLIVTFSGCYHGHADYFLVQAGSGVSTLASASSKGIPQELIESTLQLPYNDCDALEKLFADREIASKIAGVILEPIAANMGLVHASKPFLHLLRKKTAENGSLLIFDEVITGFRVAKGGAQQLLNITPDLTCFAKIVGGGFPLAAFGGPAHIMDLLAPLGPVYQAGTLSGNPVASQAGLETLTLLDTPGFYEALNQKARIITDPIDKFLKDSALNACIQVQGSFFTLFFGQKHVHNFEQAKGCNPETYKQFFHFLFEKGIYIPPLQLEALFVSMAHTQKHLEYTRDTILTFLKQM